MKRILIILKNLTLSICKKMIWAMISHPLLMIPTTWATIESILFAELNFHESHGGRGVANAFRHAAWNLLIAKNCSVFTSKRKAIAWAKYITDLHEECFPNEPFDHEMDLHNNQLGREIYRDLTHKNIKSKKQMIRFLVQKSKTAVGLNDEKQMVNFPGEMVYFKE